MDIENLTDALIFRVAQLFIAERRQTDEAAFRANLNIADYIARKIAEEFPQEKFSRQKVWEASHEAFRRGYFALIPPLEIGIQNKLAEKYPHLADRIHVVRTAGHLDNKKVSAAAAGVAMERVKKIAGKLGGKPLGLGLGPGRATRDFCECFSKLISAAGGPKLNLFAISAGCPAKEPEYASISFFNLFDDQIVNERLGFFADTLVKAKDFEAVKEHAGVKEAFKKRDQIHMVVTSMGDMHDEHDLLRLFLEDSKVNIGDLCDRGWIGNVQYRPYTEAGPVKEGRNELRAVTLFELDDLRRMVTDDDKAVILIARQCGRCQKTHAEALKPLLRRDSNLKVFSDLVMDAATGEKC